MSTVNVILHRTEKANADLSTKQFTLVKYDTSGGIIAAGAADKGYVLEDAPKQNEHGTICLVGVIKCKAGGTIAAGDPLESDTNGAVITATSNHFLVGTALEVGHSGDLVEMVVPANGALS